MCRFMLLYSSKILKIFSLNDLMTLQEADDEDGDGDEDEEDAEE